MTISDAEMSSRLIALADRLQPRWFEVPKAALSPAGQVFRSVWELEAEVNNGGFDQYFFNSSGEGAPFVTDALRAIGAHAAADIAARAIASSGDTDALEQLDQEFFAYPDDLTALLYAYASDHRGELGAPPGF